MSTINGRVIFAEPPTTLIIPGTHLKYETSSIDLSTVPLNGGVLAKTRLLSPDPYMRGKLRVPQTPGGYGFQIAQPYVMLPGISRAVDMRRQLWLLESTDLVYLR